MRTQSAYRQGNITIALISWLIRLQVDLLRILLLVVVLGVASLSYHDFYCF